MESFRGKHKHRPARRVNPRRPYLATAAIRVPAARVPCARTARRYTSATFGRLDGRVAAGGDGRGADFVALLLAMLVGIGLLLQRAIEVGTINASTLLMSPWLGFASLILFLHAWHFIFPIQWPGAADPDDCRGDWIHPPAATNCCHICDRSASAGRWVSRSPWRPCGLPIARSRQGMRSIAGCITMPSCDGATSIQSCRASRACIRNTG